MCAASDVVGRWSDPEWYAAANRQLERWVGMRESPVGEGALRQRGGTLGAVAGCLRKFVRRAGESVGVGVTGGGGGGGSGDGDTHDADRAVVVVTITS